MADILSIAAQKRDRAGKGNARSLRGEGRVPAVIYGEKKTPSRFPSRLTTLPNCIIQAAF